MEQTGSYRRFSSIREACNITERTLDYKRFCDYDFGV